MRSWPSITALLLLGCAAGAEGTPPPPQEGHDQAVRAIATGMTARDANRLVEAERVLAAAGAAPMEGTAPLGPEWHAQAEAIAGHPIPQAPVRGRVLGSAYKHAVLGEGEAFALEQIFMAGRKAKVSVVASPAARLSFAISDNDGEALCTRTVAGEPASCSWLPAWTTRYRIELRNRGGGDARVYLVVN